LQFFIVNLKLRKNHRHRFVGGNGNKLLANNMAHNSKIYLFSAGQILEEGETMLATLRYTACF
jgi:hypothetical protein